MSFYMYDGMTIGLNYWPKLLVISVAVLAYVGWQQYHMTKQNGLKRRYNERFIGIISGLFSVGIAIAVLFECFGGIVKYCDNHFLAMGDSSAWSVIIAYFGVCFLAFIWFSFIFLVGVMVGRAHHDLIIEEYRTPHYHRRSAQKTR